MTMVAKIDALEDCAAKHCKQSQQLVKLTRAINKKQGLEAKRFVNAIGQSVQSGKPKSHQDMLIKEHKEITQALKKELTQSAEYNQHAQCQISKCKTQAIDILGALEQLLMRGVEKRKGQVQDKQHKEALALLKKIRRMKKSGRIDSSELMELVING